MIGYLRGQILEVTPETVLIETSGVGYEVFCSSSTLQHLAMHRSQTHELWIYTHLREDALHLFGFLTPEEKEFYLTLLNVNGVGPKLALSILSGATIDRIMSMIEGEDIKGLTQLPKVGKKTAEQMILSLKGKLVLGAAAAKPQKVLLPENFTMISSALVNLGYKINDVERIMSEFPKDVDIQEGVRRGLQVLAKPL